MALKAGESVGGYEVIGPLGTGGMASVYQVRHAVLGSDHALKILKPELVAQAGVRTRFLDEGRVQAQLRHPGIVRVTGIVSEPGVAGLVMDLLEGRSLEDEIHTEGPLSLEVAAGWMLQALDAVGFAHERGVVHRDLKPSNLFLVQEPGQRTLRVLDFGIAKVAGRGQTRAGGTLGTYGFMAPEQLRDAADVDRRADLFALGAVLYELVCGVPAFVGETDFELMQRVNQGAYDADPLPRAVREVVRRALAVEREARFQSCEELARALRPLADRTSVELVDSWERAEVDPGARPTFELPSTPVTMDAEVEPVTVEPPPVEVATVEPPPVEPATIEPTPVVAVTDDPVGGQATSAPELPVLAQPGSLARSTRQERDDILIRTAGAAQLLTGVLNTFFLWMLSCYGMPKLVASTFGLLGLPGFFQTLSGCTAVVGIGLLVVGPLEILAGVRAQLKGAEARLAVQRTATLQIAALAFGGIPSFFVGLLTTVLLLIRRPE